MKGRRDGEVLKLGAAGAGAGKTDGLVRVVGRIGGKVGVFLVDSGATTEFIDGEFAAAAGLRRVKSGKRIQLADGKRVKSQGVVQQQRVGLECTNGSESPWWCDFEVTKLSGYDAILGMNWLRQARPRFDWGQSTQLRLRDRGASGRWVGRKLRTAAPAAVVGGGAANAAAATAAAETVAGTQQWTPPDEVEVLWEARRRRRVQEERIEQEQQPRSAAEQAVVQRLMAQFSDVFPKELPPGLPPRRPGLEHRIRLKPHTRAPYRRPYKSGPEELKLLQETIRDMEEKGFIQRSQSRYGAPVLFTQKKDGKPRMVVDYREINRITVRNGYPLPAVDELFPVVQGSRYFSKMDLHSGYYQIRIAEEDREKTAFVTRYGSYEFLVLPMGLCNSPGTFMELMNYVFEKQLDRFVIVFLDDVLVFSKSIEEHERHMKEVLQILREQRLYAKLEKCDLVRRSVEFLGHQLGEEGLGREKGKTEEIEKWPPPKNKTEVRQFLGLAGYYRKFVQGFSEVAQPLTRLTHNEVKFEWGEAEQKAFELLKGALRTAPVLALPDASKPFVMNTDASGTAIGAVLQQDHGKGLQPVGFWSRTLTEAQQDYPVHEQEMLAIVEACLTWRHLIQGRQVTVRSDHHSLQHFFTQRGLSKRQVRWMEALADFDLVIQYIKGVRNVVADALSRKATGNEEQDEEAGPTAAEAHGWETISFARAMNREACRRAATENQAVDANRPRPNAQGAVVMPSQQCTANRARGGRCKSKTAKGQYCWVHLKQQEGLRVKQSGLGRKVGMGLFAERNFGLNETVALYTGDWAHPDSGGAYALQVTRWQVIDAARTNAAPGRWANDPRGSDRRANARFGWNPRTRVAKLVTLRPIAAGEEVLVSYGREYWQRAGNVMRPLPQEEKGGEEQVGAVAAVDLVDELLKEAELDEAYSAERRRLRALGGGDRAGRVEGGLVWIGAAMRVPDTERARTLVVQECHDAPTAGHLGRDKTLAAVKLRFVWPKMGDWVERYVASCVRCQLNKPSNQRPAGELMPLPIPARPWQQISIDFVGPLPRTKSGKDGIAVMVCRFSKMKHTTAVDMKMGAPAAVRVVWQEVVRLHGVPETIVHDRDPRFTAGFWRAFWAELQTQLGISTAYHPQTDGQTERENRTLVEAIRSFVGKDHTDWDEHLPALELALNSAVQASTGVSPFKMVYGREAALPVDVRLRTPVSTQANPAAGELHVQLNEQWERAAESLQRAQERQKRLADKKRRRERFAVGDQVLLSTDNIRGVGAKELQQAVKFGPRFIGPFAVERVVNRNAYRLELPPSFGIHPTVNVSRLRRYVDGSAEFPMRAAEHWRPEAEAVLDANGDKEWEVERVLAQRGSNRRRQYLVLWRGFPLWEATWEAAENLANAGEKLRQFERERGSADRAVENVTAKIIIKEGDESVGNKEETVVGFKEIS